MRPTTIYLSGAMTGVSETESKLWRNEIKERFYNSGRPIECFDPWDHFSFTDDKYAPKACMDIDLWWLKKSDLVIVNFDHNPLSVGTNCELGIAYDRRIPIIGLYTDLFELHDWQRCMAHKLFNLNDDDVYDEVVSYILKQFVFYRRISQ